MELPDALQQAIDERGQSLGLRSLIEAREELTQRYRSSHQPFITSDAQREAYLITRLPATYAAIYTVLQAIREQTPALNIKSVLDLGAGPGTAMWAICEHWPHLEQITLIEKDFALAKLGKGLASYSPHPAIRNAHWEITDLEKERPIGDYDLVLFSYSIGELPPSFLLPLTEAYRNKAKQLFIVIEPGTPIGFERIRLIRRHLIDLGGHLIAPCPHQLDCPMADGDWCHFSVRIPRSFLHRRLKGGSLGYEDEKFSYVASTQVPFALPSSRILNHPLRHSGHIKLKLCTNQGVQWPIISKKNKELYQLARKREWGEVFSFDQLQRENKKREEER